MNEINHILSKYCKNYIIINNLSDLNNKNINYFINKPKTLLITDTDLANINEIKNFKIYL